MSQPRIIVVGGQKGGTAKSTITQNLAVGLALDGAKVGIIDADPEQHSTYDWYETRASAKRLPSIACAMHKGNIYDAVVQASSVYSHVIVDTMGSDSEELREAMGLADLLVTPFLPFQCDINTAAKMDKVFKLMRAANRKLRALVVLTKAPTNKRTPEPELARKFFTETYPDLIVSDAVLRYRMAYPRAYQDGLGMLELDDDADARAAREEVSTLYQEIFK